MQLSNTCWRGRYGSTVKSTSGSSRTQVQFLASKFSSIKFTHIFRSGFISGEKMLYFFPLNELYSNSKSPLALEIIARVMPFNCHLKAWESFERTWTTFPSQHLATAEEGSRAGNKERTVHRGLCAANARQTGATLLGNNLLPFWSKHNVHIWGPRERKSATYRSKKRRPH